MTSRLRLFQNAFVIAAGLLATGCSGADNPKMVEAPPPTITEADKAEPKGKPPGYGTGKTYQDMMNKSQ